MSIPGSKLAQPETLNTGWLVGAQGLVAAVGGMSATLGAVKEEGEVVSLVQEMVEVASKTEAAHPKP